MARDMGLYFGPRCFGPTVVQMSTEATLPRESSNTLHTATASARCWEPDHILLVALGVPQPTVQVLHEHVALIKRELAHSSLQKAEESLCLHVERELAKSSPEPATTLCRSAGMNSSP